MNPQQFWLFERIFAVGVSARRLVHWVLVIVIALNMVSSPFHAHHHDGGPDGYGTTADHLDRDEVGSEVEPAFTEPLTHKTAADSAHVGHSVSALRAAEVKVAKVKTGMEAELPVSILAFAVLLDAPAAEGIIGWHPAREQIPIPSFRTVPPDGRAPPTLHV